MIGPLGNGFAVICLSFAAGSCLAQRTGAEPAPAAGAERSAPARAEGMVMLDYQVIKVPGDLSIDLMGFHFLSRMNDWLYLGVGGYAPLFKGEYGGFMALDATAHVQRRLVGNVFADAGVSVGGGGGGKSVQQSTVLSGTGGFVKGYFGLGYRFPDVAVGLNIAKMKFQRATINDSQLNLYVQVPFSYAVGSYADSGRRTAPVDESASEPGETVLTLGLDNIFQIRPTGSDKDDVNLADLQFSRFMTKSSYWFVNAGVGYRGMPLYNQVLGGVGYRFPLSSRVDLHGQLALGSGGYAPEKIDTGPGLLVYPKVFAEYKLDRNFGLALSAGYLYAPKGSSRNYTVGASLNYHLHSGARSGANPAAEGALNRGYRIHLFPQTEFNVKSRGVAGSNLKLISAQLDLSVSDHVYIPVHVNIAYNAYLGYPGYGELLAGAGLQSRYDKDSRFQFFGQLMVGTNSQGAILKPGIGVNVGFSDRLALYGMLGQTFAVKKDRFKANAIGIGLTYRFSVPS